MSVLKLRLKILLRDRTAMICYVIAAVVMFAVLINLNYHAGTGSRVPIGLTDSDGSQISRRLCESLNTVEAVRVTAGSLDELKALLDDGYLSAVFEINRGCGEQIMAGIGDGVITVYTASDDNVSAVLRDIVSGCIIDELALAKSYNMYSRLRLPEGSEAVMVDRQGYSDYIEEMKKDPEYSFAFETVLIDPGTGSRQEPENSLIYRRAILVLAAMLLAASVFCACNSCVSEREQGIRQRLTASPANAAKIFTGEIAALFIYELPLAVCSIVFTCGMFNGAGVLRLILAGVLYILFLCVYFYAGAGLTRRIFAFQLFGTVSVVLIGAFGFIQILIN